MGNAIFIEDLRVCFKPLRSRLEAMQKLKLPTTVKWCTPFAETVNFLSLFYPELWKLLKPVYDLTRIGRQFMWEEGQHITFEELKHRLMKPPV